MTEKKEAPAKKAEKQTRITQNGVVRPSSNTKTGKVWEHADDLSQSTGEPAKRSDVLAACEKDGINSATAATQFGRWCKFNGVVKVPAEKKAKAKAEPEVEAEPEEDFNEDDFAE